MYSAPQGPQVGMSAASPDPQLVLGLYPEPTQLSLVLGGIWIWPDGAVQERCLHCQQETGDTVALTGYPVLERCLHCRQSLAPF